MGLAPIAGGTGAAVTVKVTGTETVAAPVALSERVVLYVPAARDPVDAVTVTDPLPVPEAGLSESQAAFSPADQVSVPPPVFLMATA